MTVPRHNKRQVDSDVALTLVSGISGIPPRIIREYMLFTDNDECGTHITHSVCCTFHALAWAAEIARDELGTMTPCSGDSR